MASESGGVGVLASHQHSATAGDGGELHATITVVSGLQFDSRTQRAGGRAMIHSSYTSTAPGGGLGVLMAVG